MLTRLALCCAHLQDFILCRKSEATAASLSSTGFSRGNSKIACDGVLTIAIWDQAYATGYNIAIYSNNYGQEIFPSHFGRLT